MPRNKTVKQKILIDADGNCVQTRLNVGRCFGISSYVFPRPSSTLLLPYISYALNGRLILEKDYGLQNKMAQCLLDCDKCPEQFLSYEKLFKHCQEYEPSQELLSRIQHHQVRPATPLLY